ncbi:MAG: ATP-binding cassette domain-containing protein [Thermoleophilia bacterium]|nr:ATP-binding cassette domain-containing protein [Thermoleophilia bacterium]
MAAVDDVSLTVEPGSTLAVVGANGSGKSTLVRCLLGLHRGPVRGSVLVDGVEATSAAAWGMRRWSVAYVPQRPPVGRFPFPVGELLESSGALPEARAAAERLGLGGLMKRPIDTLSGGQVQRAFLARAIGCVAAGASVVAADEPTSALDFTGQDEVAAVLLSLPVTTLIVTHDVTLAERCDSRVTMAAGRLRAEAA